MTSERPPGDHGMALLLVIAVIAVLSAVVIGFSDRTRTSIEQAYLYQDGVRLQAMVESGIDIALSFLQDDRLAGESDSLLEAWSGLDEVELSTLFEQGSLRVEIVDLSGYFPINRLLSGEDEMTESRPSEAFRQVFLRLLNSGEFAVDEEQAQVIVDSLTDWLDSDDSPMPSGAENAYYLALDRPYPARNGLVEVIDELLQVRGITAEILYGNDEKMGLSEYITIHGSGRININTAPLPIIKALAPGISDDDVEMVDEFRTDSDSAPLLGDPGWYRTVAGWPQDVVIEPSLISTRSSYFRINTAARYRIHWREATADVGRADEHMTIYYRSMQ